MSVYHRCRQLLAGFSGVFLLAGMVVLGVATAPAAVAAPAALTIGVDNATPSPCAGAPKGTLPPLCHNFEFTDFFPNGVTTPTITVHSGDIINFTFNGASPDGFHTATLLKPLGPTQTVADAQGAAFGQFPLVTPDVSDPGHQAQLNPQVALPFITETVGAPTPTCGASATNPCVYDTTSAVNSGVLFGPSPPVFDQINAPAGTTVPFVCLIHFGMVGRLVVDPSVPSTVQSDLTAQAGTLYSTELADALAQESALNSAAPHTTNTNGTTNWQVTAAAEGANNDAAVEVLEMLPSKIVIKPGDTVTWASISTREIHTVSWPHSEALTTNSPVYNAFPLLCEGAGGDTPPAGPPPSFGCGPPGSATGVEFHGNFAPVGPRAIATRGTQSTSGIIAAFPLGPPGSPVVSTTAFSFPNQNSFNYQCTVHDNMFGVVNVVGAPGYREVAADGGVFAFGAAGFAGSTGSMKLNKPIVGGAQTPDGKGYWFVAADGGVFAFGTAGFFGSTGSLKLNKPIVGMAATPTGLGYWLFASDGGVFAFGDAGFFGSTGAITLNRPVVGGVSSADGQGYWMVGADGGVFNFGDAPLVGSAGSLKLNKPVVGMAATPSGGGYFLVGSDGGIFNYGDAGFFGSTGSIKLNKPIVGIGSSVTGAGYFLVGADGGLFAYGDTTFTGSTGSTPLNSPVVGMLS